jgi:dCTP deaminase
MILPAQQIWFSDPPLITPMNNRTLHRPSGMTFGLGPAGYDVRIQQSMLLKPGAFALASTIEKFEISDKIMAFVHDKSTWARKGLTVQNTVIEPGWRGILTIELTNHGSQPLMISEGSPIAQIIFHWLMEPTDSPYSGKYQDQMPGPQPAIFEK